MADVDSGLRAVDGSAIEVSLIPPRPMSTRRHSPVLPCADMGLAVGRRAERRGTSLARIPGGGPRALRVGCYDIGYAKTSPDLE